MVHLVIVLIRTKESIVNSVRGRYQNVPWSVGMGDIVSWGLIILSKQMSCTTFGRPTKRRNICVVYVPRDTVVEIVNHPSPTKANRVVPTIV